MELNYKETLAEIFVIPPRQNQFIRKNIFNSAPVRRIAIAMKTISAFTGSYTEFFRGQQFDLGPIRMLKRGQSIVNFDPADLCRLYNTSMKTRKFQDDEPSVPIVNFKDHYVLVFKWTSLKDVIEKFLYPELVGKPLRLQLNFTFSLEQVTELIVLGERMSSVAVDKFGVVGKST